MEIKNYIGLKGTKPIRCIASDVDGTLVNDAKKVPPEAVEAIRAAREAGIRVAIASGRAWHEMDDIIDALPCLRYFICTNGAFVMDKDEHTTLFHDNLNKERALHLVRKLLQYGVFVEAYVKESIFGQYPYECNSEQSTAQHSGVVEPVCTISDASDHIAHQISAHQIIEPECFFRPNIRPFILKTRTIVPDLISYLESLPEGPEKIQIFYGYDEETKQRILANLRDNYQGLSIDGTGTERFYDVLESSEGNLEFVLPHTTKGTAVEALAKHWGYTADEVMTIGDSENDLSMIQFAGASVAMGNALDRIKNAAAYETDDNNHNGLAKAIYSGIAYNQSL